MQAIMMDQIDSIAFDEVAARAFLRVAHLRWRITRTELMELLGLCRTSFYQKLNNGRELGPALRHLLWMLDQNERSRDELIGALRVKRARDKAVGAA